MYNSLSKWSKVAVMGLAFVGLSIAQDGAALYKKHNCHTCHGADGDTPIMPVYPKLVGQNAEYSYNQMIDIKKGKRKNGQSAAMMALTNAVPDADLKAIAKWLEKGKTK